MLTQEDKLNVVVLQKTMTEKRLHYHPSKTETWKKVKVETEKINKLSKNIPKGDISELKELIYAETKLVSDKIDVPLRNPNRNTKPEWEIRLEAQVNKLRQEA